MVWEAARAKSCNTVTTGVSDEEFERLRNSRAHQNGENTGTALSVILPLPGGKVKTLQLVTKTRAANRGLMIAERFLGKGYSEIAPGVFRSADGLRQFRMTTADILGSHGNIGPHFNFEIFAPNNLRTPIKNYHMPIR